ncbi:phage major capsid protein [Cupriavidus taiwanensis]|uniref:phage major capsid protein n=1 Tax=Cupriavidus taiwanensis TaxID=164546 RepID=UPI0018DBB923|nr:phage major capsid protein [Cupriavidus taiwanensis]
MSEIVKALEASFGPIKDAQERSVNEIKGELALLKENGEKANTRLIDIEQKLAGLSESERRTTAHSTIGEAFVNCDAFKALQGGATVGRARLTLDADALKAVAPIYESIDPNKYPVPPQVSPSIRAPGMQRVWLRDQLPQGNTTSNMIESRREKAAQLLADYVAEGALKPQSDLSFEALQVPVVTIAHWILASRQVLDDVPMLQSYINSRMVYGLKLKTDTELLMGDGAAGHLEGLTHAALPFAGGATADNVADAIRGAMAQVEALFYDPNLVVLNPADWAGIQTAKNIGGDYLFGSPMAPASPSLWNRTIVTIPTLPVGNVLVGDRNQCIVWNRQQVSVEVSREDRDNFVKNMVTILVEERLAFEIFADGAFAYGAIAPPVAPPPLAAKATTTSSK